MRPHLSRFRSCLATATFAVLLLASPEADAFCRTKACELDGSCQPLSGECVSGDTPITWGKSCLSYAVQLDGSPISGLDADQVANIVAQAFETWRTAECPGGGSPSFDAVFQGFVTCDRKDSVCGASNENVNVVMFHDAGWPYESNRIAITSPTGDPDSGKLIDADIELNSESIAFVPSDAPLGYVALDRAVLHELGHFLGLGHSDVEDAIMSTNYQDLPDAAVLSPDDIAGICDIYPPSQGAPTCAESSPAYDQCVQPEDATEACAPTGEEDSGGCSVSPLTAPGSPLMGLVPLSLLALARLRRKLRVS